MGRHAEGWKLRNPDAKNKNYGVRFTHNGERIERSTGTSDPKRAVREAARIYADVINGRVTERGAGGGRDLAADVEEWLVYYRDTHTKNERSTTTAMSRARNIVLHFVAYESITPESVRAWGITRLGQVTRKYHRKERSTLRVFLAWAFAKGYCPRPFELESLPQGNGVRVTKQKAKPCVLTPEQVETLLEAMPERTHGGGGNKALLTVHQGYVLPLSAWARVYGLPLTTLYYRHVKCGMPIAECVAGCSVVIDPAQLPNRGIWVKPFFEVVWETGLRPITVMRLEAGVHYTKGSAKLLITDEVDKKDFGRVLPLTSRARAALDRVYPASGSGPLFGLHDYDAALELAKRAARPPTPRAFTKYDFRHSRITSLVRSTGDVLGTGYLVGHKNIATTAVYTHGKEEDAERVLRTYDERKT